MWNSCVSKPTCSTHCLLAAAVCHPCPSSLIACLLHIWHLLAVATLHSKITAENKDGQTVTSSVLPWKAPPFCWWQPAVPRATLPHGEPGRPCMSAHKAKGARGLLARAALSLHPVDVGERSEYAAASWPCLTFTAAAAAATPCPAGSQGPSHGHLAHLLQVLLLPTWRPVPPWARLPGGSTAGPRRRSALLGMAQGPAAPALLCRRAADVRCGVARRRVVRRGRRLWGGLCVGNLDGPPAEDLAGSL